MNKHLRDSVSNFIQTMHGWSNLDKFTVYMDLQLLRVLMKIFQHSISLDLCKPNRITINFLKCTTVSSRKIELGVVKLRLYRPSYLYQILLTFESLKANSNRKNCAKKKCKTTYATFKIILQFRQTRRPC